MRNEEWQCRNQCTEGALIVNRYPLSVIRYLLIVGMGLGCGNSRALLSVSAPTCRG